MVRKENISLQPLGRKGKGGMVETLCSSIPVYLYMINTQKQAIGTLTWVVSMHIAVSWTASLT